MFRKLLLVISLLFLATSVKAQQGTFSGKIVAAPSLGTITSTINNFPLNFAVNPVFTSSTNGFNSSCTATFQVGTSTAVNLPVTFNSTNGTLTGVVSASMTSGATVGATVTITFSCNPVLTLTNPNVTLPNAQVGVLYNANLASLAAPTGGTPPYSWTATGLPAGLSVNSSSGNVSGMPSGAGSFKGSFTVTDSTGVALKFGAKIKSSLTHGG